MAQVVIRNLDDQVMERLKTRAAEQRKSLEQSLRDILAEAAKPSPAERVATLRRIRGLSPPLPAGALRAEDLVREDRDAR